MKSSLCRFVPPLAAAVSALVCAQAAQAAPAFRGGAQAKTSSNSTSLAIARPPGVLPGDVLIAAVDARLFLSQAITAPNGWQLLRRDGTTSGTSIRFSQALFYRVAGQLEPPLYSWRFGKATGAAGAVLAYGGVDPAAPIADHAGRRQSDVRLIAAPSVATPFVPSVAVGFYGTTAVRTFTPPAGTTERHEISSGGSSAVSSESAELAVTSAGVSGERRATVNSSARRAVGQFVSLRPLAEAFAPPPPPPPPPPSASVVAVLDRLRGNPPAL